MLFVKKQKAHRSTSAIMTIHLVGIALDETTTLSEVLRYLVTPRSTERITTWPSFGISEDAVLYNIPNTLNTYQPFLNSPGVQYAPQ